MKPIGVGWGSGLAGVFIFSGSLPATRLAVADFSPLFLTSARAIIAALIGSVLLLSLRQTRPTRQHLKSLAIVALGVVIGFPLLTALALQEMTASYSVVFIGMLPLATAVFAVVRGGERPQRAFWLFAILGAVVVAGFALHGSEHGSIKADTLMLAAVIICGLGYAEGASLSRQLGGWQVISWALLLSLPITACATLLTLPATWDGIGAPAWAGLAYVSIFSMLIGFVFWYHGLALGGTAKIGQLQLLQPFLGLLLCYVLLGEPVTGMMIAASFVVVLCVFAAKRFA